MNKLFKSMAFLSVLFASITFVSCKKDKTADPEPAPTPYLEIKFGYFSGFNFNHYSNQASVPIDSVIAHDYFGVSIAENDLPSYIKATTDSLVFDFDVKTKNDTEHFTSKKNTSISFLSAVGWNTTHLLGEFGLPFKISQTAVPGNDTLEFSDAGDFFKVDFTSHKSTLTGSKTLTITD